MCTQGYNPMYLTFLQASHRSFLSESPKTSLQTSAFVATGNTVAFYVQNKSQDQHGRSDTAWPWHRLRSQKRLKDLIPIVTDHHEVVLWTHLTILLLNAGLRFDRAPLAARSLCGVEGAKHWVRMVQGNWQQKLCSTVSCCIMLCPV